MNWTAIASVFHARSFDRSQDRCPDLVIGCVDTRAARRAIQDSFSYGLSRSHYWLDLGNNASSGQYVLGQPLNACNRRKAARLRTVSELYPEIVDESAGEDPLPSCSAAEALDRQEPFINQTLAASALAMLAQFFRYGKLTHHGAFFNAKTGQMSALPVDPVLWRKVKIRTRRAHRGE
jgi:PRTRC genetic system ThiF family protein